MIGVSQWSFAQKLISIKSETSFFSNAVLEDISAISNKGKSVVDLSNGDIAFSIPIKSFEFDKALMQEHFNEKYMESEKFPKATFTGQIESWENKRSNEKATTTGVIIIHGVSKELKVSGLVEFRDNKLFILAKFKVRLEDFGIKVPSIMFQKIAEVLEVTIHYEYQIDEK